MVDSQYNGDLLAEVYQLGQNPFSATSINDTDELMINYWS